MVIQEITFAVVPDKTNSMAKLIAALLVLQSSLQLQDQETNHA